METVLHGTVGEYQVLYMEKNAHMEQFLEQVTPFEFYRGFSRRGLLSGRGAMRIERLTGSR